MVPSAEPSVGQAAFGVVFLLVLAAIPLWWSFDETETGNRIFLWVLALLALALAAWRAMTVVSLLNVSRSDKPR